MVGDENLPSEPEDGLTTVCQQDSDFQELDFTGYLISDFTSKKPINKSCSKIDSELLFLETFFRILLIMAVA